MSRRLGLAALLVTLGTGAARADETMVAPTTETPEPVGNQEIGGRLGFQLGLGGVTPGGARAAGTYLYRLNERDWFDSEAAIVFGSGDDACYQDRQGDTACDHGLADGFGMGVAAGIRRYTPPRPSGFEPYLRGMVSLSFNSFSDHQDIAGGGLMLMAGAGGRFKVANRVRIGAEALVMAGAGLYNRDLGVQLLGGMVVQLGIEFEL